MSLTGKAVRIGGVLLLATVQVVVAAPSSEEIAQAIRQLGDDEFAVREKASAFLWSAGKAAEPALKEAARSDDPEVAFRARTLLDRFKWGIYPDTPETIRVLIDRYRTADSNGKPKIVKELFELGGPGYAAVLKFADAEDNANDRKALQDALQHHAWRAVPGLLVEGNVALAEQLLEKGAVPEAESGMRNYAVFLTLRGKLEERIAHYEKLSRQPNNLAAWQALMYLYHLKGDLANALKACEGAGKAGTDSSFLFYQKLYKQSLLFEQKRWKELAELYEPQAEGEGESNIEILGYLTAYHRLAGNREGIEKAVKLIRKLAAGKPDDNSDHWYSAKALLLNARTQDAIDVLLKGNQHLPAFQILVVQRRFREAFEVADRAQGKNNKMENWIELYRAQALYQLGEKDRARAFFTRRAAEIKDAADLTSYHYLVQVEAELGLKEEAFDHCARILARTKPEELSAWLFGQVFPEKGSPARVWYRFLRDKFAAEESIVTLKRVRDLLEGKVTGKELDALAEEAEQAASKHKPEERGEWLYTLAETCETSGRFDLARTYFEKYARLVGTSPALLSVGDHLARRKLWKDAAVWYGQAWEKDRQQALPLYLQGQCLVQDGQEAAGRKLMETARMVPLGNAGLRADFANALDDRGQDDAARREFELAVRVGWWDSSDAGWALGQLAWYDMEAKEFLKAADLYQQGLLRLLRTNTGYLETRPYVTRPYRIPKWRARGFLAEGKVKEALREAEICLELLPGDVELPIHLVPGLEKLGHKKEADQLFERVAAFRDKLCTDYPRSSLDHNDLAWLLARCRRQLDKALAHAQKAVELEDRNVAYLDTLAEVHFQRGEKDKAIAAIKKCIELEPKNERHRKQLERIEAGDLSRDVP